MNWNKHLQFTMNAVEMTVVEINLMLEAETNMMLKRLINNSKIINLNQPTL